MNKLKNRILGYRRKIPYGTAITLNAGQLPAKVSLSPRLSGDPDAHLPGRIMPHVLLMTTCQLRDPVPFLVQVITGYGT
jgi:hypothetical protein